MIKSVDLSFLETHSQECGWDEGVCALLALRGGSRGGVWLLVPREAPGSASEVMCSGLKIPAVGAGPLGQVSSWGGGGQNGDTRKNKEMENEFFSNGRCLRLQVSSPVKHDEIARKSSIEGHVSLKVL